MDMSTARRSTRTGKRKAKAPRRPARRYLPKSPTGISGFDEVTGGGLPRGRTALVCGGPGCGKTLFGLEFLVRGVTEFGEPGVFIAFEEKPEELVQNVESLGFDLGRLLKTGKLGMDYVHLDRSEIDETGEYDLEGLFVRLGHAIDQVGAKRVVLDTIEALFASLDNHAILRAELRRLFAWLKDRKVTAVITCERGEGTLTRHGLEEYVSDCVILLDHRVLSQVSTRRLRVVKYRGTAHGTHEYPFLIDQDGLSVIPITSVGSLNHAASNERIGTGIRRLDEMLGGKGFYRGSSILLTGGAGTGKTSLAAHFAQASARRGERCLYVAFEESEAQLIRNMRSIGLGLESQVRRGMLRFHATRSTRHGLEMHLAMMHKMVDDYRPAVVVIDPISNLMRGGTAEDAGEMLVRLLDYLRSLQITAVLTSLSGGGGTVDESPLGVSSLVDAWLGLKNVVGHGARSRTLSVLKSRGMQHAQDVREFLLTNRGIDLRALDQDRAGQQRVVGRR